MIGQKLGSFRIEEVLGTGAMGVVYRAVYEPDGRMAAVKVIAGEGPKPGNASERFRREADILKQFRHPNIVRFLAVGRSGGRAYLAMEFVRGETLDAMLERRGPLPWREVVDLVIPLCEALHYAHQRGVVHRDLKPSNLMLNDKGQLKLTDFGIAKDLDATALTATGKTLGTAAYMAPEQIKGTPEVSHKTDLYALGALMYQMLTGELPFKGPTAIVMLNKHLTEPPPRPSDKVEEIPRALDDLVVQLMAKEPQDRPWDAQAVAVSLTELRDKATRQEPIPMVWPTAQSAVASAPVPTVKKAAPRKKKARREPWAVLEAPWIGSAAMSLALVALLALAGYLLWPPSAANLFRKAEAAMKSEQYTDWILAEREFLDELDRRYPRHPYQDQVRAWRDRIGLHRAERRADVLERPNLAAFSKPKDDAERLYVEVFEKAAEAEEADRPGVALALWREMAASLTRSDDEEARPWGLLAAKRARALVEEIKAIRRRIEDDLASADAADLTRQHLEAMKIRLGILEKYGDDPELTSLTARARAGLPRDAQATPPSTTPDPARPGPEPTEPPE